MTPEQKQAIVETAQLIDTISVPEIIPPGWATKIEDILSEASEKIYQIAEKENHENRS